MDLERNAAGMSSVAEARAAQEEDPAVLKKVDRCASAISKLSKLGATSGRAALYDHDLCSTGS